MKLSGLTVLVTGGAGFIGSNLVDELARDNHVVVLDDFSSGRRENLSRHAGGSGVRIIEGDIRDEKTALEATRGVDVVFHLAVRCLRVSINDPVVNHEVNAGGTLTLCMAARESRVRRFVYVSSSEVYGTAVTAPMAEDHPFEPTTVYGASKLAGQNYTLAFHRTYGLETMAVIPFNTYGPREHFEGAHGEVIPKFAIRALNGVPPVIFGDGSQTRDFTYVSDTVRGIIAAAGCDAMVGQTVNIARGEEVSIRDIAAKLYTRLGVGRIAPVFERERPGDVHRHYAGVEKARRLFGFSAGIGIDQGLELFLDWFTAQGYDLQDLLRRDSVFNWER